MNVIQLNRGSGSGHNKSADKPGIVAALDVGSTKVCCLIGEVKADGRKSFDDDARQINVLGVGHHAARGLKAGAVIDLDEAEKAIRLSVDAAERMAGVTIDQIYVNVSGGRPQCRTYRAATQVPTGAVSSHDLHCAVEMAMQQIDAGKRLVLHATPVRFDLDDAKGVRAPEGMFADKIGVDVNVVTVEPGAMRNLGMVVENCHLNVAGFVMAPYAAGRSVLVDDETELGVTLIDMGGATTSISVFAEGKLVFADVIPIGGLHITSDMARGLSTTIAQAERLKTLSGNALASLYDDRELVTVAQLGEQGADSVYKVPRSMLTGIIRPRVEEIFEFVSDRLERCPATRKAGRRVVLAGGGSQLTGMREAAGQMLDRKVRLGSPHGLNGLPDAAKNGAFAVATGLLKYAAKPDVHTAVLPQISSAHGVNGSYFRRMGQWIKESF
ncbi:MAG: cell division protein FtsA [Aestuariivirgaceae bacterium]